MRCNVLWGVGDSRPIPRVHKARPLRHPSVLARNRSHVVPVVTVVRAVECRDAGTLQGVVEIRQGVIRHVQRPVYRRPRPALEEASPVGSDDCAGCCVVLHSGANDIVRLDHRPEQGVLVATVHKLVTVQVNWVVGFASNPREAIDPALLSQ